MVAIELVMFCNIGRVLSIDEVGEKVEMKRFFSIRKNLIILKQFKLLNFVKLKKFLAASLMFNDDIHGYGIKKLIDKDVMDKLLEENIFIIMRVSLEINKCYFDIYKLARLDRFYSKKMEFSPLYANNALCSSTTEVNDIDSVNKLVYIIT